MKVQAFNGFSLKTNLKPSGDQPKAIAEKDLYIEKDASINEILERYRHSATVAVLERRDVIVVASVSCIYGLWLVSRWFKVCLKAKAIKSLYFHFYII